MEREYEEIAPALKEYKIENDGVWLSWNDLWRIDAVVCRNAMQASMEMEEGEEADINRMLFQNFVGQRMLIEEIAALIRPKETNID